MRSEMALFPSLAKPIGKAQSREKGGVRLERSSNATLGTLSPKVQHRWEDNVFFFFFFKYFFLIFFKILFDGASLLQPQDLGDTPFVALVPRGLRWTSAGRNERRWK